MPGLRKGFVADGLDGVENVPPVAGEVIVRDVLGVPVDQVFPDGDLTGQVVMVGDKIIETVTGFTFGEVLKRFSAAEAGAGVAEVVRSRGWPYGTPKLEPWSAVTMMVAES